jgi:nitroimidazol reductase NimA-like FMN-containing flavoprotein (pyridoxamine 5'-phosphate oxidase superfamily)
MCIDDEPYIVPMCFGHDGNSIYFHCAREGKKMDIIRKNERVCFELEGEVSIARASKPCKWSIDYISAIGFGRASIVEDVEEKKKALTVIMDHYGGKEPYEYSKKAFGKTAIIKIEIDSITCKKSL